MDEEMPQDLQDLIAQAYKELGEKVGQLIRSLLFAAALPQRICRMQALQASRTLT